MTSKPIITPEIIRKALAAKSSSGRPLLLLDLGIPRNIDPQVGRLGQVYLRNIDELREVVDMTRAKVEKEMERAREIHRE